MSCLENGLNATIGQKGYKHDTYILTNSKIGTINLLIVINISIRKKIVPKKE